MSFSALLLLIAIGSVNAQSRCDQASRQCGGVGVVSQSPEMSWFPFYRPVATISNWCLFETPADDRDSDPLDPTVITTCVKNEDKMDCSNLTANGSVWFPDESCFIEDFLTLNTTKSVNITDLLGKILGQFVESATKCGFVNYKQKNATVTTKCSMEDVPECNGLCSPLATPLATAILNPPQNLWCTKDIGAQHDCGSWAANWTEWLTTIQDPKLPSVNFTKNCDDKKGSLCWNGMRKTVKATNSRTFKEINSTELVQKAIGTNISTNDFDMSTWSAEIFSLGFEDFVGHCPSSLGCVFFLITKEFLYLLEDGTVNVTGNYTATEQLFEKATNFPTNTFHTTANVTIHTSFVTSKSVKDFTLQQTEFEDVEAVWSWIRKMYIRYFMGGYLKQTASKLHQLLIKLNITLPTETVQKYVLFAEWAVLWELSLPTPHHGSATLKRVWNTRLNTIGNIEKNEWRNSTAGLTVEEAEDRGGWQNHFFRLPWHNHMTWRFLCVMFGREYSWKEELPSGFLTRVDDPAVDDLIIHANSNQCTESILPVSELRSSMGMHSRPEDYMALFDPTVSANKRFTLLNLVAGTVSKMPRLESITISNDSQDDDHQTDAALPAALFPCVWLPVVLGLLLPKAPQSTVSAFAAEALGWSEGSKLPWAKYALLFAVYAVPIAAGSAVVAVHGSTSWQLVLLSVTALAVPSAVLLCAAAACVTASAGLRTFVARVLYWTAASRLRPVWAGTLVVAAAATTALVGGALYNDDVTAAVVCWSLSGTVLLVYVVLSCVYVPVLPWFASFSPQKSAAPPPDQVGTVLTLRTRSIYKYRDV